MLPVLFQIRVKLCLGSFEENVVEMLLVVS